MNNLELKRIANQVRQGIIEAVYHAKSGHPGGSLSATDMMTYLFFEEMNVDAAKPKNPTRDRFVLSKGHATPLYYSVLANKGFFSTELLKEFRHLESILQGHPEMKHVPGVDMSTGSLGQGVSAAAGMALSAKVFGLDYKVFVILGDGELQEGEVWEAAMFAGAKNLDNLFLFIDNNGLQIDGKVADICSPYPIADKFRAFNFNVYEIDGHDFDRIRDTLAEAKKNRNGRPTAIIASTVKGKGVSFMENQVGWHGKAPNEQEYQLAMEELKKEEELLCQQ